jgi:predicted DNA-binding transcriptional regulator YafY
VTAKGGGKHFDASLPELVRRLPRQSALGMLLRGVLARPDRPLDPTLLGLASRLLLVPGPTSHASVRPLVRPAIFAATEHAFVECLALRIEYVNARGEHTRRVVEPHGLLLNATTWSVVAFDHQEEAGRTFRLDRMRTAEVTATRFLPVDARRLFEAGRKPPPAETTST